MKIFKLEQNSRGGLVTLELPTMELRETLARGCGMPIRDDNPHFISKKL